MDKLIKVSQPGFGLVSFEDQKKRPVMALEKRSDACASQLQWLEDVNRINPRILDWLRNETLDHDRYVYTLVVPLGADESWEETVNGDAFERYHLRTENPEWGHKSFENYGVAYTHHRNNDPSIGFGDLPFMVYDDAMDRCEGIWRLDRKKARDVNASYVLDKIEAGKPVDVSMGCRVKNDVCSLCGNEAKTPAEYCPCVRDPGFGHIDPVTYRKMRVFNPHPKFFDLSAVLVKAAPEALVLGHMSPDVVEAVKSMSKVSGHAFVVPSAVLGAHVWGKEAAVYARAKTSSAAPVKISDMIKEVPILDAQVLQPLHANEEPIDRERMKTACMDQVTTPAALSTMAALGIVPSPQEFADVFSVTRDEEHLHHACPCMEDVARAFPYADDNSSLLDSAGFNPGLAMKMFDMLPSRSIFFPFLRDRILSNQSASPRKEDKPKIRIDVQVSGVPMAYLYASYIKTLAHRMGAHLRELLLQYPSMLGRVVDHGALTSADEKGSVGATDKLSQLHAQAVLPSIYILSRAGQGSGSKEVLSSVRELHVPGVEAFFGGVIRGPRS